MLLAAAAGTLSADIMYTLNNRWYFPTGPNVDSIGGILTSATVDSRATVFSTDPGNSDNNQFNALATVSGSPFLLGAKNETTIGQATSSTPSPILSISSSGVTETGVTVTGGTGTGYLLPTFRIHGTLDVPNTSLQAGVAFCAGNASCILSGPPGDAGGFENVDLLFTPAIDASTSFQFGTPFSFFFFIDAAVERAGDPAQPGATVTSDFTGGMQLLSMQVVDASGQIIRGAQIHSQVLDLASAPEPGSLTLCFAALLIAVVAGWRNWHTNREHEDVGQAFIPLDGVARGRSLRPDGVAQKRR